MIQFNQAREMIQKTLKNNDAEAEKARKEKQKLLEQIREQNINNFIELYVIVDILNTTIKSINDSNNKLQAEAENNSTYNRIIDDSIIDLSLIPDYVRKIEFNLQSVENDLILNHNIDTEQLKKMIKEEVKKKLEM